MEILEWVKLHWSEVLLYVLQVVGAVAFIINTLKVHGTRNALTLNFKAREQNIISDNKRVLAVSSAKVAEANAKLEAAQRLYEESRQIVAAERSRMEKERAELMAWHKRQMQKYKESLLEITQADTRLVSKGIAENVAKRFSEEEEK